MYTALSTADWEALWAPYDQPTYRAVLELIQPGDVVFDIGAGDLRLAHQLARHCKKVYAVEINPNLLKKGLKQSKPDHEELVTICADARQCNVPEDTTVGVLLMRHCQNFKLYAQHLKDAGVERFITNARWRMSVECVRLQIERLAFKTLTFGWFACWCGATGFKPGPVEAITPENEKIVHEVIDCPWCAST